MTLSVVWLFPLLTTAFLDLYRNFWWKYEEICKHLRKHYISIPILNRHDARGEQRCRILRPCRAIIICTSAVRSGKRFVSPEHLQLHWQLYIIWSKVYPHSLNKTVVLYTDLRSAAYPNPNQHIHMFSSSDLHAKKHRRWCTTGGELFVSVQNNLGSRVKV